MDTVKYGVHTVSAPYPHGVGTGQAPDKVLGKSLGEDPMRGRILVRMAKSMEDIIGDRARAEGITRGAWARRHLARAVGQPQSSRSRQRLPGPDRETKMLGDGVCQEFRVWGSDRTKGPHHGTSQTPCYSGCPS